MSRYGVYPGNTSASTSTTGDTITDNDDDLEDLAGEEQKVQQDQGDKGREQDPGACSDDSTTRQSTTASTPVFELPFEFSPLDPLSLASAFSFQSGEALTPLERFAFNALIEHYCAQRVSHYLSPNLPHHIHEAYKKELYRRVTSSFGMTGGFDRDEFKGVRESILEGISGVVNSEMVNIIQQAPMSPSVEYTPSQKPDFDSLGVEIPEGNEVVRRVHRPKSSENLAPMNFIQASRRLATGLDRPATSDGRKIAGLPGSSRNRDGSHFRDRRRPELMRAMSFDHLNRAGGGPKTPPLAPPKLSRGATSFASGYRTPGYRTPQQRTPSTQSHPFKFHSFGPAPPPSTRERDPPVIPSVHHKLHMNRIPPHISNMSTIRASVSLQQKTAQGVPMERSWSVDRAISLFHPQHQLPTQQSQDHLQRIMAANTSRYKTDFTEIAFLGKGGFASVYKVRHVLDGREYAIKKVPIRNRHLYGKKEKLDVIFKEIKTLAKLEHKNVVRYYGAWVESANGLWERPGSNNWSKFATETGTNAKGLRENITVGYGTTLDGGVPKAGPVRQEIPVLGGAAFIDENDLNDPFKIESLDTADADLMGIQFGEDTSKDSDSFRSPAKPVATANISESSSSGTEAVEEGDEEEEDPNSDIEIIPRINFPPLPTQIPLPVSPQIPVEYLQQRRRSFVSSVDEEGNELPYAESFARGAATYSTVSGSDSGLGERTSPPKQLGRREILEAFKRHKPSGFGGGNGVFEGSDDSEEETEDETEGNNSDSTSDHSSRNKHIRASNGNRGSNTPQNKQIALVEADRLARREADRREILTLMIKMSVHPLTLKEFLSQGDTRSTSRSVKHQFPLPRGLAIQIDQPHHESTIVKGTYCWHTRCALKLFRGILEGAEYLHKNGIVHRDLKPGNIFLNIETGNDRIDNSGDKGGVIDCHYCNPRCGLIPRIGDFGLVAELVDRVRSTGRRNGEDDDNDEVLRGNVVGTALYRPPPSIDDDEKEDIVSSSDDQATFALNPGVASRSAGRKRNIICEKTDVYALGIIFFELLYRCGTGSERVKCLVELRDGRRLPEDWKETVAMEGGLAAASVEVVGRCVLGMTERRRASRWGCQRVKEELRKLDGWE